MRQPVWQVCHAWQHSRSDDLGSVDLDNLPVLGLNNVLMHFKCIPVFGLSHPSGRYAVFEPR